MDFQTFKMGDIGFHFRTQEQLKGLVLEGIEKEGASSSALSATESSEAGKYPSAPSLEGVSSSAPSTGNQLPADKHPSTPSSPSVAERGGAVNGEAETIPVRQLLELVTGMRGSICRSRPAAQPNLPGGQTAAATAQTTGPSDRRRMV